MREIDLLNQSSLECLVAIEYWHTFSFIEVYTYDPYMQAHTRNWDRFSFIKTSTWKKLITLRAFVVMQPLSPFTLCFKRIYKYLLFTRKCGTFYLEILNTNTGLVLRVSIIVIAYRFYIKVAISHSIHYDTCMID